LLVEVSTTFAFHYCSWQLLLTFLSNRNTAAVIFVKGNFHKFFDVQNICYFMTFIHNTKE